MVENDIPSERHHSVWMTCMRWVKSETQFMENFDKLAARKGFFSVDKAIPTRSHVAFLRMTMFAAWVLFQLLHRFPNIRDALHAIGINFVLFAEHGIVIWLPLGFGITKSKPRDT